VVRRQRSGPRAAPQPRSRPRGGRSDQAEQLARPEGQAAAHALARLLDVLSRLHQAEVSDSSHANERCPAHPPPTTVDGKALGRHDLLDALAVLRRLSQDLAAWEPILIAATRAHGATWNEIAAVLGLASRQAAERRFLRLSPQASDRPETTREQRVQTARDQRSGDRAVAAWARENAAELRQLAARISALPARAQGGQDGRDAIHAALGDDDAAALVAPLSGAGPSLRRGHQDLADQVETLEQKTAEIRNADQDRRDHHADVHDRTDRRPR
jgi:hypothetical protein